jgi:hypothetical protein
MRATESDLERIRESIKASTEDPLAAQAWVARAKLDLELLVEDLTDRLRVTGGSFAVLLRDAIEAKVLEQVNGRVRLTRATTERSVGVHVTPVGVFVDVRLEIGVGT